MSVTVETTSQPWRKARSVNQTSASFVAKVPVQAEPKGDAGSATGSSVIDTGWGGSVAQNGIVVVPYGSGNDDVTMSVRVIGWRVLGFADLTTAIWVPVTLCEVACTLGTTVGVAGLALVGTERLADTLTLTTGDAGVSIDLVSPGDNTVAHFVADIKGFQKIELSFTTGGSATDCNALIAFL